MSKQKPRCRYNCFKYCPEKPFYVREDYPFGNIKDTNTDGCDFWWIDLVQKAGQEKPIQLGMCIDKWNAFYMKDYGLRALGNQQATEMLRNGLCDEYEITTADGKKIKQHMPKSSPLLNQFINQLNKTLPLLLQIQQIADNNSDQNTKQLT